MTSLSMNTVFKVLVQGDLYYSSDYSFFTFNFVCQDFASVHSYGYLSVFSLFYSGLTILILVHFKSCIYIVNCSSLLNTAPAFGGLLRSNFIFRYFKIWESLELWTVQQNGHLFQTEETLFLGRSSLRKFLVLHLGEDSSVLTHLFSMWLHVSESSKATFILFLLLPAFTTSYICFPVQLGNVQMMSMVICTQAAVAQCHDYWLFFSWRIQNSSLMTDAIATAEQ